MRKLSEVSNQYVLGIGWIDQWWDLDDGIRRFCIKNPTIKKPNKDVLFEHLPLVSKEDHINLYLSKDEQNDILIYTRENASLERYEKITFSGIVKGYSRKDGSFDYGIHPTKFSNIHFLLEDFDEELCNFLENLEDKTEFMSEKTLLYLEYQLKPRIYSYRRKLEESGNELPTFIDTYKDYVDCLENHLDGIQRHINMIRTSSSNRSNRRYYKLKNDFSKQIEPFEKLYPNYVFNPN